MSAKQNRGRFSPLRRPSQRGVTLSELLVALGLSGFVATVLLALAQLHGWLQQRDGQSQMIQDNTRSALEEIVQNVRRAGASFTSRRAENAVPPKIPAALSAIQVQNSSSGPDSLRLILTEESEIYTVMRDEAPSATTFIIDRPGELHAGDYVTLSNFSEAVLYRLTQDPTSTTLPGNSGDITVTQMQVSGSPTTAPLLLNAGTVLTKARLLGYSISSAISDGTLSLVLREGVPLVNGAEELIAEHIEDLQIAVGVDGLLSGLPNGTLSEVGAAAGDDEWVYNIAGESLPDPLPDGAVLLALRITVIGRGTAGNESQGFGRPAAEDRPAGSADGFRRRVLTTQVALRSLITH